MWKYKVLDTRIKALDEYDGEVYYAQVWIETTFLYWTWKKWHSIRRYELGIFGKKRLDDFFDSESEAQKAIEEEVGKLEHKVTVRIIEQSERADE